MLRKKKCRFIHALVDVPELGLDGDETFAGVKVASTVKEGAPNENENEPI